MFVVNVFCTFPIVKFNIPYILYSVFFGAFMFYPCWFYPRDAPGCAHFLKLISHLLEHTTNNRRKVRAPRHVSASSASNVVQNCHLDETNMDNSSMHPDDATTFYHFFEGPYILAVPYLFSAIPRYEGIRSVESGKGINFIEVALPSSGSVLVSLHCWDPQRHDRNPVMLGQCRLLDRFIA